MRFFFRTFGCKTNQYETQALRELAARHGHEVVADYRAADVVVVNTCTVTSRADRDVYKFVRRVHRAAGRCVRVVLTGCFAERVLQAGIVAEFDLRLGTGIPVDFVGNDRKYDAVAPGVTPEDAERVTELFGHRRAYVKVQDGCDCFCSYCIVPHVRRTLRSKQPSIVVREISGLERSGFQDVVLIGTNLGKYAARESGQLYSLAGLCRYIVERTTVTILFSSLEPTDLQGDLLAFLSAYRGRIFPHFHIPLQSGDDEVLRAMRRPYTTAQFARAVERLRTAVPGAIISTDLIVAYPEETPERFERSLHFVQNMGFGWLHVFPYSPRPGTAAYAAHGMHVPKDFKERVRRACALSVTLGEERWKPLCRISDAEPAV